LGSILEPDCHTSFIFFYLRFPLHAGYLAYIPQAGTPAVAGKSLAVAGGCSLKSLAAAGALTVDELQKMAQLFNMTTDQVIHYDGKVPAEVVMEDKTALEQMRLIQQLDEDDRQTIFKLIDKMLTNKKFKDFFQKNVAAL
jgi:hypothetical protein